MDVKVENGNVTIEVIDLYMKGWGVVNLLLLATQL